MFVVFGSRCHDERLFFAVNGSPRNASVGLLQNVDGDDAKVCGLNEVEVSVCRCGCSYLSP